MGIFRVSSPEGAAEAERVMGEAEGTDAPALPPACTSQVLSCLFPRYLPRSFPGALAVFEVVGMAGARSEGLLHSPPKLSCSLTMLPGGAACACAQSPHL